MGLLQAADAVEASGGVTAAAEASGTEDCLPPDAREALNNACYALRHGDFDDVSSADEANPPVDADATGNTLGDEDDDGFTNFDEEDEDEDDDEDDDEGDIDISGERDNNDNGDNDDDADTRKKESNGDIEDPVDGKKDPKNNGNDADTRKKESNGDTEDPEDWPLHQQVLTKV